MRARTTWILLLLAAALGAYILLFERRQPTTRERQERQRQAFALSPDGITRLAICWTNAMLDCRRAGDDWVLADPPGVRADAARIRRLLTGLQTLKRGETITGAERHERGLGLADYGLAAPRCEILLAEGTRTQVFAVGASAPGDAVYVQDRAAPDIYSTSAGLLTLLPQSVEQWRDHLLLHGAAAQARRLEVRCAGNRFVQLAADNQGVWTIQQPVTARAAQSAVQEMLEKAFALRVEQFVRDNVTDLSVFGMDPRKPDFAVTFDRNEEKQSLLIGQPLERNTNLVYAAVWPGRSVYAVNLGNLDLARITPDSLRDRRLVKFAAHDLRELVLRRGESLLALRRAGTEAPWRIVQPRQWPADPARMREFIDRWLSTPIEAFVAEQATNAAAYGLAPAAAAVTFSVADAPGLASQTLLIGATDTNRGLACVKFQDEPAIYGVSTALTAAVTADPLALRSREVLTFDADQTLKFGVCAGGRVFMAVRGQTNQMFQIAAPTGAVLRAEVLTAALLVLSRLPAERWAALDPSSLAPYGLDQPAYEVSYVLSGESGLAKSLLIGARASDGFYAMVRGQDAVCVLHPVVVKLVAGQPLDAAAPRAAP